MNESDLSRLTNEQIKDRYYRRNVAGISSVEFLWGLGLPVVAESTFLQLFVRQLGASKFQIGLIPSFFFIGISFFALYSSYFTSRMMFKRSAVVLLHLVSGFSLLVFGIFLYLWGDVSFILFVFFVSYGIFALFLGMTIPVWLNYLVHILSEEKAVSGIAFMLIAQNSAKLIGSLVIVKVVSDYSFSMESSAIVFVTVGGLLSFGSLFFLITRELPEEDNSKDENGRSFISYTITSFRGLTGNRNFLRFLAGDFEFYIIVTVISFYADYATTYRGIAPAIAAGVFVGCIYGGAIVANLLLGTMGFLQLKQKYILSKFLSFSAVILLISLEAQLFFFIASFLLGAARGARMVSYAPAIKQLSGASDSTSYFAVAPIVTLPLASGLPLVIGHFLDAFEFLGAGAYQIVFGFCALLILVALFFMLKTDFPSAPEKQ